MGSDSDFFVMRRTAKMRSPNWIEEIVLNMMGTFFISSWSSPYKISMEEPMVTMRVGF
jgi:hypothetical protein